jgi:GNAT superfamily N-acetyltransferase
MKSGAAARLFLLSPSFRDAPSGAEPDGGRMLRQLAIEEADQAAAVLRTSFDQALPTLAGLHTPDEDRWFVRERLFVDCQIWGYFNDQELVGIIAFREGWIDQLYILPTWQRRRIGTALLKVAQDRFDRLSLWTFQRNQRARSFYEKQGFVAIRETDGARNEEKDPDVMYSWRREHRERV